MSDDTRREAVESAADALDARYTELNDGGFRDYVAHLLGEVAYDAIEPLVRRAVADEIAARIEATKPSTRTFWDSLDARTVFVKAEDAKIARQVGGGE